MDLSNLKAKAGPLPIWGWGAILGVAAIAFIYLHASNSAASSATDGSSTTASDATLDPDTGGLDYQAAGLGASQSGTTTTDADSVGASAYQSNDDWLSGLVNWFVGQGQDAVSVRQALQTYLNGGALTQAQDKLINTAIGHSGDAPDGLLGTPTIIVPPTTTTTTNPPKTTTPPTKASGSPKKVAPKSVSYTIKKGDSLSAIAKHFYGSASAANIAKIAKANHISNPNLIIAGHKLVVPAK